MSALTFDIRPTRAYMGLILHRLFVSPFSLVVYVLLLAPIGLRATETGDYTFFAAVIALLSFAIHIEGTFIARKLQDDREPVLNSHNLGCYMTFDMVRAIQGRGHVTVLKLIIASTATRRGAFILRQLGVERKEFLEHCRKGLFAKDDALLFVEEAVACAKELDEERIDANSILYALFKRGGVCTDILNACDVSLDDLRAIVKWESFHNRIDRLEWILHPRRIARNLGTIGRSWVQGYTNELDSITKDISGSVVWDADHRGVCVHQEQLEQAVQVLSRSTQRNVLVTGPVGSGKRTLVRNVGALLHKQEVKKGVTLTRQLVLKTEELMSGFDQPDSILLRALQKGEKAGNILLIVENLALILRSKNGNLRNVFTKFLQSNRVTVFVIASSGDYHSLVKSDPVLDSLFEKIHLGDTTEEETMAVLMMRYFVLEEKLKVHATYKLLKLTLNLSKRFIGKGALPGKVLEVLSDAMIAARDAGMRELSEEHIRKSVSLKAHMDVSEVSGDEKVKLLRLETALQQSIVGQNASIHALVNTLKRARLDINAGKRPLGTFLFLGPTGVGKTHTAKVLAQEYFGGTEALIRMDMNEYSNEESVFGIIGDPDPAATSEGFLTKQVQERPFSLILLDEIEKAHKKVLNLFLQILDEGKLTDSRGVQTDFRNSIIIATSNAGALFIRDFIQKNEQKTKEEFKEALIDTILKDGSFSPEFVNRFDEVILYYPLSVRDAIKVALLMLQDIVLEIEDKKGYKIRVEEDVVVEIVQQGYSIEFGAREMRRVILDIIENFLAEYLLRHDVKRGEEIYIGKKDIRSA